MAWCFKLKTDQKVFLFNYCLKNYSGSFLVKNMLKKGYYKNEGLSLAWDRVKIYENHIKMFKIIKKCIIWYKSA